MASLREEEAEEAGGTSAAGGVDGGAAGFSAWIFIRRSDSEYPEYIFISALVAKPNTYMSRYHANIPQIYARILIPSRSSAILFFPPPPILSKILALKSGTELEVASVELRRMHRVLRQRRAGPALGRHPSMILGVTGKRDNAEKGRIVFGLVVFRLYSSSYASFKLPWSPGRQSYPLPYLLHCLFFPDIRDLAMVRPCSFRRPHLSFASVQVSRAHQ